MSLHKLLFGSSNPGVSSFLGEDIHSLLKKTLGEGGCGCNDVSHVQKHYSKCDSSEETVYLLSILYQF